MKKWIILLLAILIALTAGIYIGKSQSDKSSKPIPVAKTEEKENDTSWVIAQKMYDEKYPIYMEQGGFPLPEDKYRHIVDRWYGFRFRVKSNTCTNPDNLIVDKEQNRKTDSILTARIGSNWRSRFENTVDSLYRIDTLACHIAENNKAIQQLIKQKTRKYTRNVYISYNCLPTTDRYIKAISIEWPGKIYNDTSNVSFIRAFVNINTQKVSKIDDVEMEWKNSF